MYIQLTIELSNGEVRPANAYKNCSFQEAKEDVMQVLKVAERKYKLEITEWHARFCDFDEGAQVLVDAKNVDGEWTCQLKFINCSDEHVQEVFRAWVDASPTIH